MEGRSGTGAPRRRRRDYGGQAYSSRGSKSCGTSGIVPGSPIIVNVLFGIVEFGFIMYSKGVITNANREGARFGAVLSSPRQTKTEIKARVSEHLGESGFTPPVTVDVTGEGRSSGTPLAIQLTYTENFRVLQIVRQSLTGSLALTAETVMLME